MPHNGSSACRQIHDKAVGTAIFTIAIQKTASAFVFLVGALFKVSQSLSAKAGFQTLKIRSLSRNVSESHLIFTSASYQGPLKGAGIQLSLPNADSVQIRSDLRISRTAIFTIAIQKR
eukprot:6446739-Amphidinium_carterae.1